MDFIAWLLIGAIAFATISVLVAMYHSADQEVELLHYYRNPSGKRHEIIAFISKTAVRFAGAVGFLFWMIVFFRLVNPALVTQFFAATLRIDEPISWLWMVLSVVLLALSIYAFAVLARFIMLRVRVFG